ncbi:hypothetical protein [Bradyrhizobium sp. USDA 4469]
MSEKPSKLVVPKIAQARRSAPVLVCRKCLKRCDEGRKVRRALKSELKAAKREGTKTANLVMTSCFGLCPKTSIVVASGATLRRQEYVLISDREQVPRALVMLGEE